MQERVEVFVSNEMLLLYNLSIDIWGPQRLDLGYEKITNSFKSLAQTSAGSLKYFRVSNLIDQIFQQWF
jgi:hypothetical protein